MVVWRHQPSFYFSSLSPPPQKEEKLVWRLQTSLMVAGEKEAGFEANQST